MPGRKVADAHILFSAEGLKALEKDAKGSIDRILGMLKGAESKAPEGPFSQGLLRDISLMKDMNRAVAGLIAQKKQLMAAMRIRALLVALTTLIVSLMWIVANQRVWYMVTVNTLKSQKLPFDWLKFEFPQRKSGVMIEI